MEYPRLGRVSYLNCQPLLQALETEAIKVQAKIVADHPAVLNKAFGQGKLEVTAVSSLAYEKFTEIGLILPELSISSYGKVGSVLLMSKVPLSELKNRSVSLTPYSATSVALLRIILQRFYRIHPDFFIRPVGGPQDWGHPDAFLTIGDEALNISRCSYYPFVYDLGEEWQISTGKPMVFALWVARRDFASAYPEAVSHIWVALQKAKSWGREHLDKLAKVEARRLEVEPEFIKNYFSLLNYDLNWPHLDGLLTFYRLAQAEGLLSHNVVLNIWSGDNEGFYRLQNA